MSHFFDELSGPFVTCGVCLVDRVALGVISTVNVPLLDLTRVYRRIEPEVTRAVEDLLHTQQMILGPAVAAFEERLADYCAAKFAIGCASGTDALILALMALDISANDHVITTPFTFFATAGSIWRVCARPVFVDIDPDTFNINPDLIEDVVTKRTKAILPVHLYGQSADMDAIGAVAEKHDLKIIEDAAQAIGATFGDRMCGTMGDVGCLSFYPTKNLGAMGDGGALLTDDADLAESLRSLRVHGAAPGDAHLHRKVGLNSRLDALQAVILSVKMEHLDTWNDERRRLADYYTRGLSRIDEVKTPVVADGRRHVFHQYTIRVPRRDELMAHLDANGVTTRGFYARPLHLQECFDLLGHKEGDFPEAEKASREVLCLPIYPGLTTEEQDHVVEQIAAFFARA